MLGFMISEVIKILEFTFSHKLNRLTYHLDLNSLSKKPVKGLCRSLMIAISISGRAQQPTLFYSRSVHIWYCIKKLKLKFFILTSKTPGTHTSKGIDRMDRSEEHRVGRDEWRRISKLEYRNTFFKVKAGFPHTNIVIKRQNLEVHKGNSLNIHQL